MIHDLWMPYKASTSFAGYTWPIMRTSTHNRSNMLHTLFIVAKLGALSFLLITLIHYCGIAVDRWCDFCEGLWEQEQQLKEPPGNP